mmetsp:Transcript_32993/g.93432  ORF Transcript_32993/g.93432 Transcript_32993/m.93432 type:complete len:282 (-) Transcript_32993:285-1130(-)
MGTTLPESVPLLPTKRPDSVNFPTRLGENTSTSAESVETAREVPNMFHSTFQTGAPAETVSTFSTAMSASAVPLRAQICTELPVPTATISLGRPSVGAHARQATWPSPKRVHSCQLIKEFSYCQTDAPWPLVPTAISGPGSETVAPRQLTHVQPPWPLVALKWLHMAHAVGGSEAAASKSCTIPSLYATASWLPYSFGLKLMSLTTAWVGGSGEGIGIHSLSWPEVSTHKETGSPLNVTATTCPSWWCAQASFVSPLPCLPGGPFACISAEKSIVSSSSML